jgi:hypothetical protein
MKFGVNIIAILPMMKLSQQDKAICIRSQSSKWQVGDWSACTDLLNGVGTVRKNKTILLKDIETSLYISTQGNFTPRKIYAKTHTVIRSYLKQ